jgi:hypothetical protein
LEDPPTPNWAERVTAIATALSAFALPGDDRCRHFRGETSTTDPNRTPVGDCCRALHQFETIEETRRLVARFETGEALRDASVRFIAENSVEACSVPRARRIQTLPAGA